MCGMNFYFSINTYKNFQAILWCYFVWKTPLQNIKVIRFILFYFFFSFFCITRPHIDVVVVEHFAFPLKRFATFLYDEKQRDLW